MRGYGTFLCLSKITLNCYNFLPFSRGKYVCEVNRFTCSGQESFVYKRKKNLTWGWFSSRIENKFLSSHTKLPFTLADLTGDPGTLVCRSLKRVFFGDILSGDELI